MKIKNILLILAVIAAVLIGALFVGTQMSQTVANESAIIFALVAVAAFVRTCIYAPPEMNDGVIFRSGKFNRFVPDGKRDMTIPFIEKVRVQSISRFARSVNVVLASVLSADNDPCTLTLQATYKLDLPKLLANDTSEICEALKEVMQIGMGSSFTG